jgi:2',3'-cyclic-nucleotide 2'-phosphodiesterase (5'-nucleotidase family)
MWVVPLFVLCIGAARVAAAETSTAASPPAAKPIPVEALVPGGERPDFVMLYTGDVIGYLEDCGCKRNPAGGLARRAWVVEQLEARFPGIPFVLLDSGNFSDNPTPEGDSKTVALLGGMERLHYRVVNVGERDIRMGYDEFRKRTASSKLEFVSANLVNRETQQPVFAPHAIVELLRADASKIRIGVTGAMRYNPVFVKAGPDGSSMVIASPVERVRQEVEALEKQGVDIVVLLAALHEYDATEIARAVPRIDFILGAYGGLYSQGKEGDTPILYVGNRGQRITETRVFMKREGEGEGSGAGTAKAFTEQTRMHFLTHEYPEGEQMRTYLQTVYEADPKAGLIPPPAAETASVPGG